MGDISNEELEKKEPNTNLKVGSDGRRIASRF